MSTHTNKTIQQICDEDTGDSSLITNLVRRGKELEEELRIANREVTEAIRQVAASDSLYRKMCAQKTALISAHDRMVDAEIGSQNFADAGQDWDQAKANAS